MIMSSGETPAKLLEKLRDKIENMNNSQALNALINSSSSGPPETAWTLSPIHYSTTNKDNLIDDNEAIKISPDDIKIWMSGTDTSTFLPSDTFPKPEINVEQIMKMAQISQVPSLKRAVDELATVIKRLIEKYQLGPIASLAFIKLVEINIFQSLIKALNEKHGENSDDAD